MQVDQLVSRYLAMDLPEHSARQPFFTHSIAPLQLLYQRRRPERSVGYQVVQQNLETWLALRSRGLVWIGSWCGAMSRVSCQFRIGGSVHFPAVTRIKSLRTPNKCDL